MMSNNANSGVEYVVRLQAENAAHFHSESLDLLWTPFAERREQRAANHWS